MIGSDYNFYGLVGLLLVKIVFVVIFILYCCKKSDEEIYDDKKLSSHGAESSDLPPSYSDLMDNKDPPIYIASILNEEINPELNKEWALDLENHAVKPEIEDVIQRSRTNSFIVLNQHPTSHRSESSASHLNNLRLTLRQEALFFPRSII